MSGRQGHFRLISRDWQLIGLNCLLLSLFYLRFHYLTDPDDILRMLQVRAWLDGQSWFDLRQYRIVGLQDVPMHWSRLVDIPLAGVVLVAQLFTGRENAEHVAQVAVPLLALGCTIALIYRATFRLSGDRVAAALSPALGCLSYTVFIQFGPGRVDHHGWQIVLALVALNGLLGERVTACAWVIGAALATWLTISIEGLPLAVGFLAVLALRWLRDPAQRGWLVHGSASLAVTSMGLWLATHQLDGAAMTAWCDVVTPVHLAMFAWTAIGTAGVSRLPSGDWLRDSLALGAVAAVAGAIFFAGQPQCIGGAFSQLDPYVAQFWLESVGEAQPVWQKTWAIALMAIGPAILGWFALAVMVRGAERHRTTVLFCYLVVLFVATALGVVLIRASGVASALAAPPVAWLLWISLRRLRLQQALPARLAIAVGLIVALQPWALHALMAVRTAPARNAQPDCNLAGAKAALDRIPPSNFLVPLDLGPRLLQASHHSVLASAHHRGRVAMRDEIEAFTGTPDQAHAIVRRRHMAYVGVCFTTGEAGHYRRLAPNGLMAQLYRGEVPDWLQPVEMSGVNPPKVWRIVK